MQGAVADPKHRMRNAGYCVHDAKAASQERSDKLQGRVSSGLNKRQAANLKTGLDLLDKALGIVNPPARDFQLARARMLTSPSCAQQKRGCGLADLPNP